MLTWSVIGYLLFLACGTRAERSFDCATSASGYYCDTLDAPSGVFIRLLCVGSTAATFKFKCFGQTVCMQREKSVISCLAKHQWKPPPSVVARPAVSPSAPRTLDCSNAKTGYYCDASDIVRRSYTYVYCKSEKAAALKMKFSCPSTYQCKQKYTKMISCKKADAPKKPSDPIVPETTETTETTETDRTRPQRPIVIPTPPKDKLTKSQIPMWVYVSNDDAITPSSYSWSKKLFDNRKNPNNCPLTATYNAIEVNTKFDLLKKLYDRGHEIASHSVSHRTPSDWWAKATKKDWENEIVGFAHIVKERTGIPPSEIRGMRAPFLQFGGNKAMEMLVENGFTYDSSLVPGATPIWPYRVTRKNLRHCRNPSGCPTKAFPQIWEVPLNKHYGCPIPGYKNIGFAMIDQCATQNFDEALGYLKHNFDRHYKNKVPFGLNMHFAWFAGPHRQHQLEAFGAFLDDILQNEDVYVVSVDKILQWMENPVPLEDMKKGKFAPVNC